MNDPEVLLLLANAAAWEGVILQRAHSMVTHACPGTPTDWSSALGASTGSARRRAATSGTCWASELLKPQLPSLYVALVKLDPSLARLQMSAFMEEVMSHLQALPGAQIEMNLEVQVNAPGGIDEQTARIVLENSAALKIDKLGMYQ